MDRRDFLITSTSFGAGLLLAPRRANAQQEPDRRSRPPGYFEGGKASPLAAGIENPLEELLSQEIDCVVVGSGTAGITSAIELARLGHAVVVVEAGPTALLENIYSTPLLDDPVVRDRVFKQLQYDIAWRYGDRSALNYMISAVGGRSLFWNGWTPRFSKPDFADWPLTYENMEPYYEEVERLIGVVTDGVDSPYSANPLQARFEERLNASGWFARHPPAAIDTTPTANGHVNRGCDSAVARVLRSGFLRVKKEKPWIGLASNVVATHLLMNAGGKKAAAVVLFDRATKRTHELPARAFVLAASAPQSTRLVARSKLADPGGTLGTRVTDHLYVKGIFRLDPKQYPERRGSVNLLVSGSPTERFQIQLQAPTGELVGWDPVSPSSVAPTAPEVRLSGFGAPVSLRENRLVFDERDDGCGGMSAISASYQRAAADEQLLEAMVRSVDKVREVLRAQGESAQAQPPGSAHHEAGGLPMARNDREGMTDSWGRLFAANNVAVADAASWPSQGAANPYLTITACALRASRRLGQDLNK